jgi:hypothetical protein
LRTADLMVFSPHDIAMTGMQGRRQRCNCLKLCVATG